MTRIHRERWKRTLLSQKEMAGLPAGSRIRDQPMKPRLGSYGNRPIWLLLDKGPSHTAGKSLKLAAQLNITLIWLPKQRSELNPMDHFWRALKSKAAANRQFRTIDDLVAYSIHWIEHLTAPGKLSD